MRADYTYGDVYTADVASMDGHRYRAHVERHAYTGPATALPLRGLVINWGTDGGAVTGAAPLAPVAASRARLRMRDDAGLLAEVVGAPDGAWRLRVERLTGSGAVAAGGPGTVWLGYLLQEGYEDAPYGVGTATELTFADGLGLLEARPAAGEGADTGTLIDIDTVGTTRQGRRLLDLLARHLTDLGADAAEGLVTAADWRPWVPSDVVPATQDPVRSLLALEEAWQDRDGASVSVLAALRAVASRLGARLFQSAGRWHLVQRGLLCRTLGADVPRFAYAAEASPSAATVSADDVAVDTRAWLQAGPHDRPRRGITVPVRSVQSVYDVEPDLDDLLVNPGFEIGSTGSAALGWTLENGAIRRAIALSPIPDLNPSSVDAYFVELAAATTSTSHDGGKASQANIIFLPGSKAWELTAQWQQAVLDAGAVRPTSGEPYNWGALTVGDPSADGWGLTRRVLTSASTMLHGPKRTIFLQNALMDSPACAEGEVYVPAGAVLRWMRDVSGTVKLVGTQTLDEPIRAGDTLARGTFELSTTTGDLFAGELYGVRSGDFCEVYVWEQGAEPGRIGLHHGGWPIEENAFEFDVRHGTPGCFATGVDVDGNLVTGWLNIEFEQDGDTYLPIIDDVLLQLRIDGRVVTRSSALAALPAGASGLDVGLEVQTLGDGPTLATLSGLYAQVASKPWVPTVQGTDTGWTDGAYADALAESTGRSIDLHAARDGLRQLAGPLERVRTTYLLRGGQALSPEHVAVHWQLTTLALPATAGTETVYTRAAPRVGRTLVLGGVDYEVESVERGAGLYAVGLAEPLASSLPATTRVAYDVPAWWDSMEWDIPSGGVYYDATALDLHAGADFLEEIGLGTS